MKQGLVASVTVGVLALATQANAALIGTPLSDPDGVIDFSGIFAWNPDEPVQVGEAVTWEADMGSLGVAAIAFGKASMLAVGADTMTLTFLDTPVSAISAFLNTGFSGGSLAAYGVGGELLESYTISSNPAGAYRGIERSQSDIYQFSFTSTGFASMDNVSFAVGAAPAAVPELDMQASLGVLVLLAGGILVLGGVRRRQDRSEA